jgi:hypothetical protein
LSFRRMRFPADAWHDDDPTAGDGGLTSMSRTHTGWSVTPWWAERYHTLDLANELAYSSCKNEHKAKTTHGKIRIREKCQWLAIQRVCSPRVSRPRWKFLYWHDFP